MQADPITAAAKQAAREALAAERDAALSRAEAAERERDALLVVARAAGDVLHYGNAFAAGERTMLDVLDEALDALPTGMLDQSR